MVYRDHQDGKLNIIQYTCAKYKGKAEVLLGCVRQPLVSEFFWRKVLAAGVRAVEVCGVLWSSVELCGVLWSSVEFCGVLASGVRAAAVTTGKTSHFQTCSN